MGSNPCSCGSNNFAEIFPGERRLLEQHINVHGFRMSVQWLAVHILMATYHTKQQIMYQKSKIARYMDTVLYALMRLSFQNIASKIQLQCDAT